MSKFNPSYIAQRPEILELIPTQARFLLDVGCSNGEISSMIKEQRENIRIVGIEYDATMAEQARERLDEVIVGDLNQIDLDKQLQGKTFDCIVMADILEHLVDPWNILKKFTKYLSENGVIIVSIPNIRHISTLSNLVFKGYWPYRDRGIHDRTHLRFFTLRNILELFSNAGMSIQKLECNYRIIERPHSFNRFAKLLGFWPFKGFFAYQYIVVAVQDKAAVIQSH